MTTTTFSHGNDYDVIDHLVGIQPGDAIDTIRRHRPQARTQAQQSYLALFQPTAPVPGNVAPVERYAVAAFVVGLHQQPEVASFYAAALAANGASPELTQAITAEIARGAARGPYGRYPSGPLSAEDAVGPSYTVAPAARAVLGDRLAAALEHAHLLVFHPRDASPAALQQLLDAGWSSTDVVILSQLVAFLSFQIRVVVGLRVLAHHRAPSHHTETQP